MAEERNAGGLPHERVPCSLHQTARVPYVWCLDGHEHGRMADMHPFGTSEPEAQCWDS